MNEEEKKAIKEVENFLNYEGSIGIHSISILYTLFLKQQKEIENKEDDYTTVYMQGFYDGKNRFKDKIKEKIDLIHKEYAEIIEKNKNDLYLVNINAQRHNAMQSILEELLGE